MQSNICDVKVIHAITTGCLEEKMKPLLKEGYVPLGPVAGASVYRAGWHTGRDNDPKDERGVVMTMVKPCPEKPRGWFG